MRGCLGFLVLFVVIVGGLGFAVAKLLVPSLVVASVEGSPLFRGQPVTIEVETSVAGVFLRGRADRIVISGSNLSEPKARIGTADVTLTDVSLFDRSFASITGAMTDVDAELADGTPIHLSTLSVTGGGATIRAVADIDAGVVADALLQRLAALGIAAQSVALADGRIDVGIAGQQIGARFVVAGSDVYLDAGPQLPRVTVFSAGVRQGWRVESVVVTRAGLQVTVIVEP